MIPLLDLKEQYQLLKLEIDAKIQEVLHSTRFILGPNVQAFEQEAADFLGVQAAISCASGTDALHLALKVLDLQPGDEVITTPFTFIATAEAIAYCGATPVFVDIDPHSYNLDLEQVSQVITAKTKAIMPVHLFGQPVNMSELQTIAQGIPIIEDCAQSFGATWDGRMTGSIGLLGAFSFFPSKNLGAFGDGGLVTTNDLALAEQIKILRNHGSKVRYYHDCIGYNSRLDEIQAAILRVKLPHLPTFNSKRRALAAAYNQAFAETPEIQTPQLTEGHVFHQYTIILPEHSREAVMAALKAADIGHAIYYPVPIHRQEAFAQAQLPALPIAEAYAARCLSLPIYPELPLTAVAEVAAVVKEALCVAS
jgi:dTDP-4-amino-4,6-dideoxygalactose transaminase